MLCWQSEEAAIHIEGMASIEDLNSCRESDACNKNKKEDDIQSIAESVRSSSSDLRSIHSQKSIEVLVVKAKETMSQNQYLDSIRESEVKQTPVIITHQDDDGARIAETKSLSKLPFKNRNPAL